MPLFTTRARVVKVMSEIKKQRWKAFQNGVSFGLGCGFLVLIITFWIFKEEITTFTSRMRLEGFYMLLPTMAIFVVILWAVGIAKEAYDRAKIP